MRILVIADIHGNDVALEAVLEKENFDVALCLGDLVDYGPEPGKVIQIVKEISTYTVMGNHDYSFVFNKGCLGCTDFFAKITFATRNSLSYNLKDEEREFLKNLPEKVLVEIDGLNILMVHGTIKNPYEGYITPETLPHIIEQEMEYKGNRKIDLVLFGHSHVPMEYEMGDYKLVNPGSVGFPRDGSPGASYVVINNGKIEFKKIKYDFDRALKKLREMNLPQDVYEFLTEVLKKGE